MAERDKLAAAELGDRYGGDKAHCGKLKELLEKNGCEYYLHFSCL
jgi:hypothetical protein